ncbi:MAG: hypothetical protein HRT87_10425 [Legionellales bacterium]|nr:hypothetical protein [Legionellales bacterium]
MADVNDELQQKSGDDVFKFDAVDKSGLNIISESISGFMVFIIEPDNLDITSPKILDVGRSTKIIDRNSIISIPNFDKMLDGSHSNKDALLGIKKIAEICTERKAKQIAVLGIQSGQRAMKVQADILKINITNFPSDNQYAHLDNLVNSVNVSEE